MSGRITMRIKGRKKQPLIKQCWKPVISRNASFLGNPVFHLKSNARTHVKQSSLPSGFNLKDQKETTQDSTEVEHSSKIKQKDLDSAQNRHIIQIIAWHTFFRPK